MKIVFENLMAGEIKEVSDLEIPVLTKKGDERIILWTNTVFTTERGDIISALCSGEDITDRKLAESEAIRASQMASLGELAAGVAHEINNPINGIINYSQIIANKSDKTSVEYDIAMRIIKEGDRIAGIVRSLLSFARDSKEKKNPVQVQEILDDSMALTEAQIRKDGIKLTLDIPPDLPSIYAQPQHIEQVFLNVISNARYALNQKYQGPHKDKILQITARTNTINDHDYLMVTFLDKGTGIPPDIQARIMNPFFSTKPTGKGTGLGLSISHGIISDHNGIIDIDSIDGNYTKVIIKLPVHKN